jgi:hypothetical protein
MFVSLKIKRSITDTYIRVRKYPPLLHIKMLFWMSRACDFQSFHETTARNADTDEKFYRY